VLHGDVELTAHGAGDEAEDAGAFALDGALEEHGAGAGAADDVFFGHRDVFVGHFAQAGAIKTAGGKVADGHAGGVGFDKEAAQPVTLGIVHFGIDDVEVGARAAGGVFFDTVDDPAVAGLAGGGGHIAEIAAAW